MPELTFDLIKPIVDEAEQKHDKMVCRFKCPKSGEIIEATAKLEKDESGLFDRIKSGAGRSLGWTVRRSLSSAIYRFCGGGTLGFMASDLAYDASRNVGSLGSNQMKFNEKEKQQAILQAFISVQSEFVWDNSFAQYVGAKAADKEQTPFMKKLANSPVCEKFDMAILARMMVEIAASDGELEPEEKIFIADFIPDEMGSIEDLLEKSPITKAEIDETEPSARETMLMVAFAVALTDEELEQEEVDRLNQYAGYMNFDQTKTDELKNLAQDFIADQTLTRLYDENDSEPEVIVKFNPMASAIGLSKDEADRAHIRFKKRHDLF